MKVRIYTSPDKFKVYEGCQVVETKDMLEIHTYRSNVQISLAEVLDSVDAAVREGGKSQPTNHLDGLQNVLKTLPKIHQYYSLEKITVADYLAFERRAGIYPDKDLCGFLSDRDLIEVVPDTWSIRTHINCGCGYVFAVSEFGWECPACHDDHTPY